MTKQRLVTFTTIKAKRIAIAAGAASVIAVVLCALLYLAVIRFPWLGLEPWSMRKARFAHAAERARPLVEAIRRYEQEHGQAPASLQALLPGYLPRVPRTGLLDYPDFIYNRFTNTHYSLLWWDLGHRNGKPMTGLWCYAEGDPNHAILALTVDQQQRVVAARVDRMPAAPRKAAFDSGRWRKKEGRMEMVRSLPQHTNLLSQGTNAVLNVLGSPDGESTLRDSPWELRINCSWAGLNWDVFFYWPTGKYPGYIYGGSTERIGDWVYVHE
jgi:hypothetical protein